MMRAMRLWICGLIAAVLVVAFVVSFHRAHTADNERYAKHSAMIQSACGTDIVYAYERFGVFSHPVCWKVVCVNAADNIYRERIKCEDGAK